MQSFSEQSQTYSSQRHRQESRRLLEDILVGYQLTCRWNMLMVLRRVRGGNTLIILLPFEDEQAELRFLSKYIRAPVAFRYITFGPKTSSSSSHGRNGSLSTFTDVTPPKSDSNGKATGAAASKLKSSTGDISWQGGYEEMMALSFELILSLLCEFRSLSKVPMNFDGRNTNLLQLFNHMVYDLYRILDKAWLVVESNFI
nr:hypothetical protein [Tanacetum cinerariifolium]